MNRINFLKGKKAAQIGFSEFRNKYDMEYVSLHDADGDIVCDYLLLTYIEKTGYSWEESTDWHIDMDYQPSYTKCTKCYNFADDINSYFSYADSYRVTHVDNSLDMLPLYMKWALKFKGIKFDAIGYALETEEKMMSTLNGLYQNINGKNRLRNFTECHCFKCGKEWIVFDQLGEGYVAEPIVPFGE